MNIIEVKDILLSLGLRSGDNILVSSDVMRLLIHLSGGDRKVFRSNEAKEAILDQIIDCLQEIVGEQGTLLFPTYTWGFCHGETFDIRNTLGVTGFLSNYALKREDFKRTKHPIYSFAVWGKASNDLVSLENKDSFAQESPFGWLLRNNGKNLTLDSDFYFTFMHFIEESCGMTYRFIKNFTSQYIDENGIESSREYSMYVRDLNYKVVYDQNKYEAFLKQNKTMKCIEVNKMIFGVTDLTASYPLLKADMLNNKSRNIIKSIEKIDQDKV